MNSWIDDREGHCPEGTPRETILVVDEDKNVREILAFILERKGYRVLQSGDGRDAGARVEAEALDLLILEALLPYRTGFELCAAMKRDPVLRRIPILMTCSLTRDLGQGDDYWRARCSADEFLSKPFDTAELLSKVDALLSAKRRANELARGRL